jgi:hypothetical protein
MLEARSAELLPGVSRPCPPPGKSIKGAPLVVGETAARAILSPSIAGPVVDW